MAASLGEMVIQYSLGKKDLAEHQAELKSTLTEFTRARHLLTTLMSEDQAAFDALTAAKKLPANSSDRQEIQAKALNACLTVPQTVGAVALAILELCDRIVFKVNRHLLSDLAIAADLATATVRCSVYNVKINLGELPDPAERAAIEQSNHHMLLRTLETIARLSPTIWKRQSETVS